MKQRIKQKKHLTKLIPLGLVLLLFTSCEKKQQTYSTPSFPVKTVIVIEKQVPYYADTIGHATPFLTIDIRSRVEGELMKVFFKEGDYVKQGDLLFTIDPRPYQATLDKAIANLKENEANLKLAIDKTTRYQPLLKDEYISELDFDQLKTDVALYDAMIQQNLAQIEEAKLNVEYCHIYSPIDGKTGILNIQQGNLITANSQHQLISIKQITPLYVLFTLPEKELSHLQQYSHEGSVKIQVASHDIDTNNIEGSIDLIDNTIDPEIGSIQARALFTNHDKRLWPGEYLQVRVVYKMIPDALLVPNEAVVLTSQGPVVFVVNGDNTVQQREVKLGQRQGAYIAILSGVKKHEEVVTYGQLNLFPGAHVTIANHHPTTKEAK